MSLLICQDCFALDHLTLWFRTFNVSPPFVLLGMWFIETNSVMPNFLHFRKSNYFLFQPLWNTTRSSIYCTVGNQTVTYSKYCDPLFPSSDLINRSWASCHTIITDGWHKLVTKCVIISLSLYIYSFQLRSQPNMLICHEEILAQFQKRLLWLRNIL